MELKKLRIKKGWTQAEIADNLSINLSTYKNYENGYAEPNIDIIKKLANIFDVSLEFLLFENDRDYLFENARVQEPEILQLYNKMNELQQIEIVSYAKGMLARGASSSGEQQQLYSKKLKA